MVLAIDVKFELGRDVRLMSALRGMPKLIDQAQSSAIRRTTDTAFSRMSKYIRADLPIKKRDLDRRALEKRFEYGRGGVTGSEIKVTGNRLPLKDFKAKQTKIGISYTVRKGGGREALPGAFIVDRFGGHAFKRSGPDRTPIVKLHGPSVPHVATELASVKRLTDREAGEIYLKNLSSQVDRIVARVARG